MNQLLTAVKFSADAKLSAAIVEELTAWDVKEKVQRLWEKDPSLWTNDDENQWMGWLDIVNQELNEASRINSFTAHIKTSGISDVVVLGMGGSSLCPAMMANTFGQIENHPKLHILDSTDPAQILHLEQKINLEKTLFIVSSKSGATLEPNIFKDYFYNRLQNILPTTEVSERFIAITDPGTKLEKLAKNQNFKAIFHGSPSIGGRYSALSNFGMVPAALMGLDIKEFLHHSLAMIELCNGRSPQDNPAVILGVILGICEKHKKNKVTLVVSPAIQDLGAWLEQLLAESTGKIGKGLIPVDLETVGPAEVYADDRVFVYIRLENAPDLEQDKAITLLEQDGQVVVRLCLRDKMHLGAELFRWEFATAVAGSVIGINPFNQPDVEASKVRTLEITNEYEKNGHISSPAPIFSAEDMQLFADAANAGEPQQLLNATPSIESYLRAHFNRIKSGDYFDIAAFIEMSDENKQLLQKIRLRIRDAKKVATCLGFGPRFLHSTGQAYKGGPNTGVFLQITAEDEQDIQVPNHRYSFGFVIKAQAQADFEVLSQRDRRILRVHLGKNVKAGLNQLDGIIQRVLNKGAL